MRRPSRQEQKALTQFRKDCEKALRQVVKGTGWKKCGPIVFREVDGILISAAFIPLLDRPSLAYLWAKPMNLDPIFWDILQMPENLKQPLSFRTRAAIMAGNLEIEQGEVDGAPEPIKTCQNFIAWAESRLPSALATLKEKPFSVLVADESNRIWPARWETLVTAYIAEDNLPAARRLIDERKGQGLFPEGLESLNFLLADTKNFFTLADKWLRRRLIDNEPA